MFTVCTLTTTTCRVAQARTGGVQQRTARNPKLSFAASPPRRSRGKSTTRVAARKVAVPPPSPVNVEGLYAAATGYAGLLTVYLLLVAAAASLKKANRAEKEEVAFVYSTNAVGGCVGDLRAAIYVHILVYMIIIEPSIARCLCRPDSLDPSRPFYFVYPHLVRSCIRYGHRRNHPGCLGASGSSGAEAAG